MKKREGRQAMFEKTTKMLVRVLLAYGMLMVVVVPTGCDRTLVRDFMSIGRDGPSIYFFNPQPEPPAGVRFLGDETDMSDDPTLLGPQPEPPDSPEDILR
jgi:hypothetical protein